MIPLAMKLKTVHLAPERYRRYRDPKRGSMQSCRTEFAIGYGTYVMRNKVVSLLLCCRESLRLESSGEAAMNVFDMHMSRIDVLPNRTDGFSTITTTYVAYCRCHTDTFSTSQHHRLESYVPPFRPVSICLMHIIISSPK